MELIHKHNVESKKLASIDTKFRSRQNPSVKKSGEAAFGKEEGAVFGSGSGGGGGASGHTGDLFFPELDTVKWYSL